MGRLAVLGAVAGLIVAAGVWGYVKGFDAAQGRMFRDLQREQQAVMRAAELASRKEAERLAAEQERAALAQTLEDLANAEPVSSGACLPVSRVLRLQQR